MGYDPLESIYLNQNQTRGHKALADWLVLTKTASADPLAGDPQGYWAWRFFETTGGAVFPATMSSATQAIHFDNRLLLVAAGIS